MIEEFEEILDEMNLGNWGKAQKLYKSINPTSDEFITWVKDTCTEDTLVDLVLLGFYCRDYEGGSK